MSFDAPVLQLYRIRPDQVGRLRRMLDEDASLARELERLSDLIRRIWGDEAVGTLRAEPVLDPEDDAEYVRVTFAGRGPEEDVELLEELDEALSAAGGGRVVVQPVYSSLVVALYQGWS